MKAVSFFSGGKDGLFATYLAQKSSIDVKYFLLLKTTIGLSPHYENFDALKLIANACNKELLIFDMANGQDSFTDFLKVLDIDVIISGDIFLQSHYEWLKDVAKKSHKKFIEPLWDKNTSDLVYDMINNKFSYTIIACNKSKLPKKWLGYSFNTPTDVEVFESKNPSIDIAGEAGEFHTIVTNAPIYNKKFELRDSFILDSRDYYYLRFNLKEIF